MYEYKLNHSTETAPVCVQNDVLREMDNLYDVIMVLLDLSDAFDTVDHEVMRRGLSHDVGVVQRALEGFCGVRCLVFSGCPSMQHQLTGSCLRRI